ncbi:MAG: hypothetical protein ACRC6V_08015 [Bacteroidales bacterium]
MMTLLAMTAKKLIANIVLSLISEKFLEWALFNIAERIVKSTQTPHDDEWLAKVKESYYGSKEK